MKKRKLLVALLFNLVFTGLGFWYLGKRIAAIVFGVFLLVPLLALYLPIQPQEALTALGLLVIGWLIMMGLTIMYWKRQTDMPEMKAKRWVLYLVAIVIWNVAFSTISEPKMLDKIAIRSFTIPTGSMSPTLDIGDYLIASRGAITNYEPAVFKYPKKPSEYYVKRCVGLPGDSLIIKESVVYQNNVPELGIELKHIYAIGYSNKNELQTAVKKVFSAESELEQLMLDFDLLPKEKGVWNAHLTKEQADKIGNIKGVSISQFSMPNYEKLYGDKNDSWTVDNYGPIWVPRKGQSVALTIKNSPFLWPVIKAEHPEWEICPKDGQIYKNCSDILLDYKFERDYYFMMGDNRHNSQDSRFWGFVSEDLIYGPVWKVFK
ncbi:MAG: signal peptidase I [Bacteroidetes bacterium]|nr:signal peptidase I [Bacteroidota bacterium]